MEEVPAWELRLIESLRVKQGGDRKDRRREDWPYFRECFAVIYSVGVRGKARFADPRYNLGRRPVALCGQGGWTSTEDRGEGPRSCTWSAQALVNAAGSGLGTELLIGRNGLAKSIACWRWE